MRHGRLIASALFALALHPPLVAAAQDGASVGAVDIDRLEVRAERNQRERARPTQPTTRPVSTGPSAPPPLTMVSTSLGLRDDGSRCVNLFSVPGSPTSREAMGAEARALGQIAEYGYCPTSPLQDLPQVSADVAAEHLWREQVNLPSPTLTIAPGRAVTGLRAYLEIGGAQTSRHGPMGAFGYAITITTSSTYDIDWGDGTVVTGVASQGGPYPDGDVHHVYQRVDDGNVVTVTQRWTATWTATGPHGSTGGTIAGVLSTSSSLPLPVGQIQAVRNR
jgi:hypothetical protein